YWRSHDHLLLLSLLFPDRSCLQNQAHHLAIEEFLWVPVVCSLQTTLKPYIYRLLRLIASYHLFLRLSIVITGFIFFCTVISTDASARPGEVAFTRIVPGLLPG